MPEEASVNEPAQNQGDPAEEQVQAKAADATQGKTFTQDDLNRVVGERLAREREKYADYDDLKAKVTEFDDASKSKEQRVEEEMAAARWEADQARTESLRLKAAIKYGIDENHLGLVYGDDEDTLLANAERIGALLKDQAELAAFKSTQEAAQQSSQRPSTGSPRDNLRPGASPAEMPIAEEAYPASWRPTN